MAATENKDVKKDDFEARDYQVQLAEMAFESNRIIYLPTGSGKTFISVMVINHFLQKNDCGSKKVGKGGKRAFFLVNTVALVNQQVEQIKNKGPFDPNGYCGYMGVDYWDKEKWESELDQYGILVMTAQIFLNLLLTNVISLRDVAVTVFDECHHGVVDHPMRQIMQQFKGVPVKDQPRVLGLTATLINRNLKLEKVEEEVRMLETTFLSQIATADDERMVKVFSTNPREYKVRYTENDNHRKVYTVRDRLFDNWTKQVQALQIDKVGIADKSVKPTGTYQIDDPSKKTNKELKNAITDIQYNMNELGLYAGHIAVLARLIQMQQILYYCESETAKRAFNAFNTNLIFLRKYFEVEMGKRTQLEIINLHSSDKVKKLLKIFKSFRKNDSAIVFVKRRFTAKIMHKLVSEAAKVDPELKHISCDFVVGYNVSNPLKDTKENLVQKIYNDRVLEKFNSGLLNVLFGSNVVEEGMDVSKCNIVIMFDAPLDFRSYMQSKGRARHSTSQYIILTCDPTYEEKYNKFIQIEDIMRRMLCGGQYLLRDAPSKDEVDATLFSSIQGLEPFAPKGHNGAYVTALSAISHINRYLANLRSDKFTRITPYWFMKTEGDRFKCYLHLPLESKVSGIVEGTWQSNKENAKRSAALEACKKLYEHGELDQEHLLPVTEATRAINGTSLLPHWDVEENFSVGTKKSKRRWPKKWPGCLTGCAPTPNTAVYLHVVQHNVMYTPPADNSRLVAYHATLSEPVSYAIVSSKKLPQLAPFPLYTSTGELEINIMEGKLCSFSQAELAKITLFHGIIFDKICGAVNDFLIRDYSNGDNSYLIAPVVVGDNKTEVDWKVIDQAFNPFPDPDIKPTEDMRKSLVVNEENYLGMIVTPWYRTVPATKYLVTKVCNDMSENSKFPSEFYDSYKDYFYDKYKITTLINQPLLEVRALSSRMNNLKPIALTKALKYKNKNENEELEVLLLPEFCHLYPVPGNYWIKARILPSVLHRVSQLCAAEELRLKLVRDIDIGVETFPLGKSQKKLEADASLAKNLPPTEVTQLLTPLGIQMRSQATGSTNSNTSLPGGREPPNIYHEMETVTLLDVIVNEEICSEPVYSDLAADKQSSEEATLESSVPLDPASPKIVASTSNEVEGDSDLNRKRKSDGIDEPPLAKKKKIKNATEKVLKFVKAPPLNMLQKKVTDPGPEQVQMLQAITVAVANDLINCERLETLGDSFLKFAISLILFETQQDVSEGWLTNLKGQAVGNRNLYFCGRDKQLGNILEVKDFSPPVEWVPPQFCVERTVKSVIVDALMDPSCLYHMKIPEEDQIRGEISEAIRKEISEILLSSEDLKNMQTCVFTNQLGLTDKNISDAVEAIIGVYLENSGMFGALRVMNWFGVIDLELASEQVFTAKLSSPTLGVHGSPSAYLLRPELLEDILHYKFKDRAYMLEALSHPSFHLNRITRSYQRLEFLGDAIIDFLITIYIYENCKELHPGDLTDLRSALVNNITLGCISVRFGLQCFLLHRSKSLYDVMDRFVRHQEERHHKVDNDILFLCDEKETKMAEAVEVPKALGDIFEALVGAIYLDSGKNLDVTWSVIYNLMRREIETFKADVPKNHVRMLYESKCELEFSSKVEVDGVVWVGVEVVHQGQKIFCNGFGDNKYQAKRAAAKQALRSIRSSLTQ